MLQNLLFTDSESVLWNAMEPLFQNFSLQNLLRQFFCGVVFFVPLWLFGEVHKYETCPCSLFDITQWGTGTFFLFASLASIIGTIIYHIEKNLYSYSVQTVFELLDSWETKPLVVTPIAAALIFSIALTPFFFETTGMWVIVAWFVFCFILTTMAWLFTNAFRRVIKRTEMCWLLEERAMNESMLNNIKMYAIAKRISSWSDFIHCTQSCCFSWLFGCALCKFRLSFSDCSFYPYYFDASNMEQMMVKSIGVVLCILVLELIFDWHRYIHVIRMTKKAAFFAIIILYSNPNKK